MTWTYEIVDGSPLNNCWKAFCELAQALRERIILTDGDDDEAPEYTLPDASTTKTPAIADFAGHRLRSYLLRDNADVLRDAIMEKNTAYNSIWCNLTGTLRYVTAQDVIEDISAESDWIALSNYMEADFWTQIQDVMAALRYVFYYRDPAAYSGTYGVVSVEALSGPSSSLADAWTSYLADYSETSSSETYDISAGNVLISVTLGYDSDPTYALYGSGTVGSEAPDMHGLYLSLAGTILDSGYSVIFQASEARASNSGVTYENDLFTYAISAPLTAHFEYGNLAGAEIDFGAITLTPSPATSSEFVFDDPPVGASSGACYISAVPLYNLGAALSGNVIDKNKINYYLTDLASALSYI